MKEKNGEGEGEEAGPDLHHGGGGWLRGAEEGKRFLHWGNKQ